MNAKEEIIQQPKTNVQHRISWNSASIADFAENIRCTKRPSEQTLLQSDFLQWGRFDSEKIRRLKG